MQGSDSVYYYFFSVPISSPGFSLPSELNHWSRRPRPLASAATRAAGRAALQRARRYPGPRDVTIPKLGLGEDHPRL